MTPKYRSVYKCSFFFWTFVLVVNDVIKLSTLLNIIYLLNILAADTAQITFKSFIKNHYFAVFILQIQKQKEIVKFSGFITEFACYIYYTNSGTGFQK